MRLRKTNLKKLRIQQFDTLIIGGGINGAVSAAALAGKGVKTALIDRGDFASVTSQESSNLAWGGIKYLENLEFSLVRNLCKSRNQLMQSYPSTVQEIRFFTTIEKGFRFPPFFIYMGTWLYWLMGNMHTLSPRFLTKKRIEENEPVINTVNAAGGFEYSDAYLHDNDARFVFGFIRSALSSGCIAANYVELISAEKKADGWLATVLDKIEGQEFQIQCKVLINATGPYMDEFNQLIGVQSQNSLVLSKGIHLIVDRVTPNRRVLAFFASDGRLFFVIPMGMKTCIGTTDTRVEAATKEITEEDRDFILKNINNLLKLEKPLDRDDIIAERSGVRPLVVTGKSSNQDDWMSLSRKHIVESFSEQQAVCIFGGKLTDCINVGEEVCDAVQKMGIQIPFPMYQWFGEPDKKARDEFMHHAELVQLDSYTSPDSSENLSSRLWRRYGAAAFTMLEEIQEDPAQAEVLIKGTEYIRCELKEAAHREMVTKLEDFLRRRSKIALVETTETIRNSPGLIEACRILFGEEAEEKLAEYFD
jgi:glycerol-3-phosphate dehydrogenase